MTGPRSRVPPTGRVTRVDIERLGVPAATFRGWVHRGRLTRVGGSAHYPEYDAEAVLALVENWKPRSGRCDPA